MPARSRGTATLLGLVVLAGLAACDSATAGQPAPTPTRSSAEPTTTGGAEPDSDYSLARPCELISADEARELGGAEEGEEGNSVADGHAICTWADKTTLVVGFQEGTTSAEADTGPGITNTPTTVDGLPAVTSLQTDTVVICEVLVDLPSGKMVAATVSVRSAGEGEYDPCQVAAELSNLIVPRVKDQ